MLNCPKCGYDNELGRIFCHQCGTKLDLEQIKPVSRGGKKLHRAKTFTFGRAVWLTVRLAVLALLFWGLYLLAQVPKPRAIAANESDLRSFYEKRDQFSAAIDANRRAEMAITEGELNAFIATLGFEDAKGEGIKVVPTKLQAEFGEGVVTVTIVGKIKFSDSWQKGLGITYTGTPTIENGAFVFKPVAAALGDLPLHPLLLARTSLIQSYFAQLFRNFSEEKKLLGRLSLITVTPAQALFRYQPGATPR